MLEKKLAILVFTSVDLRLNYANLLAKNAQFSVPPNQWKDHRRPRKYATTFVRKNEHDKLSKCVKWHKRSPLRELRLSLRGCLVSVLSLSD